MKARNREINIFNMSLLDILCGALGAFCFMMLTLLPYYRPPGEDISINLEQKKLLDELQNIKDLAERLKFTSNAEDLTELVKKLQEQILALENEIKRLQGHLNSLLAENGELKRKVQALEQERQELLARLDQLEAENRKLAAENNELRARLQQAEAERQKLAQENKQLRARNEQLQQTLQHKVPWVVALTSDNASQAINLSLHEVNLRTTEGDKQPEFDPGKKLQPTFFRGDLGFSEGAVHQFLSAERVVGSLKKFYVRLANDPPAIATTRLKGVATGSGLGRIDIPGLALTADRPWTLAGFFSVTDGGNVTYRAATEAERQAEWNRLMHPEAPRPAEPPPAPDLAHEESVERVRRENQLFVDRFLKSGMAGLDPEAQGRVREFAASLLQAATQTERFKIMDQAMRLVRSGSESKAITRLMSITKPLPAPATAPPPNPPQKPPPGPASGPATPFGTGQK